MLGKLAAFGQQAASRVGIAVNSAGNAFRLHTGDVKLAPELVHRSDGSDAVLLQQQLKLERR
eukprot:1371694-Rhodomonas_salina.2